MSECGNSQLEIKFWCLLSNWQATHIFLTVKERERMRERSSLSSLSSELPAPLRCDEVGPSVETEDRYLRLGLRTQVRVQPPAGHRQGSLDVSLLCWMTRQETVCCVEWPDRRQFADWAQYSVLQPQNTARREINMIEAVITHIFDQVSEKLLHIYLILWKCFCDPNMFLCLNVFLRRLHFRYHRSFLY